MRERHVDAMWGLAAVALVMSARYQPAFLFYPVAAFAVAFLFFAGGYAAAEPGSTDRGGRDAAGSLGLAYGGTALASLAAALLASAGLSPGGPVPSFDSGSALLAALRDLALSPLGGAPPPALFPAAWILVALALGRAVTGLAPGTPGAGLTLAVSAVALLGLASGGGAREPGLGLFLVRTAFGITFVALGRLVRLLGEPAPRRLRSPAFLALGFVAVDVLAVNAGGLGYRIEAGDLGSAGPAVALVTTALIVLMGAAVASGAAEVVVARSALLAVGRAWRPILAAHAAVIFAIDVVFALAGALPRTELPRAAAVLDLNRLWFLELVPAIALPALAAAAWVRARRAPTAGEA